LRAPAVALAVSDFALIALDDTRGLDIDEGAQTIVLAEVAARVFGLVAVYAIVCTASRPMNVVRRPFS
jgi:hypothetical protein